MTQAHTPRLVDCPSCKTPCAFDKALNPYRPFCSARCKNLDLGAWASGDYVVPARPESDTEAEALEQALLQKLSPSDNSH